MKTSTLSFTAIGLASLSAAAPTVDWNTVAPVDIVNGIRYCEVKCMAEQVPKFCPGSFDDIRCQAQKVNDIQKPLDASGPFLGCMTKTCTNSERDYGTKRTITVDCDLQTNRPIGKAAGFLTLAYRMNGFSTKPTDAEIDAAAKAWGARLTAVAAGKKSNPSGPNAAPPPGDKPYDEAVKGGSSSSESSSTPSTESSSGSDSKKSGAIQLNAMGVALVAPAIVMALL